MIASRKRLEQAETAKAAHDAELANRPAVQQPASGGAVRQPQIEEDLGAEVIVDASGRRLVLNEAEKQNPDIMSKYL